MYKFGVASEKKPKSRGLAANPGHPAGADLKIGHYGIFGQATDSLGCSGNPIGRDGIPPHTAADLY